MSFPCFTRSAVSCCTGNKSKILPRLCKAAPQILLFSRLPDSSHSSHPGLHHVPQTQQTSSDFGALEPVSLFLECSSAILARLFLLIVEISLHESPPQILGMLSSNSPTPSTDPISLYAGLFYLLSPLDIMSCIYLFTCWLFVSPSLPH